MTYLTESKDALAKALREIPVVWETETHKAVKFLLDHDDAEFVADALIASGAVIDADTLADDEALVEAARKAIEDELIDWRDEGRFMLCGNGFTVREKDGSPSEIIRFRTDLGFRIGLRALTAALTERSQ